VAATAAAVVVAVAVAVVVVVVVVVVYSVSDFHRDLCSWIVSILYVSIMWRVPAHWAQRSRYWIMNRKMRFQQIQWNGPIGSRPKLVNYDKTDISIIFWFPTVLNCEVIRQLMCIEKYADVTNVGTSIAVHQINVIPRLFQNLSWARCIAESSRPQLSKGAEKIATWVCPLAAFQVTARIFRRRLACELVPRDVKIQRSARDVYSRKNCFCLS
jgi:hypothetical protein